MIEKYKYKGTIYESEKDVRKALYECERIALSKTPAENVKSFWANRGIELIVEPTPLEPLKEQKRFLVKMAFLNWRNNEATLLSSLVFKADSN